MMLQVPSALSTQQRCLTAVAAEFLKLLDTYIEGTLSHLSLSQEGSLCLNSAFKVCSTKQAHTN